MDRDDTHTLDVTRQRLAVLVQTIDNLRLQILTSSPLPPYAQLQKQISDISSQFDRTLSHLNRRAGFFDAAHSYPTALFPGIEHAGPVAQMLGTTMPTEVERWVEEGEGLGRAVDETAAEGGVGLGHAELDELWGWAAGEAVGVADEVPFGIDFTLEERDSEEAAEGVRTGVRRKLDDGMVEVDEDEEEGVEKMDTKEDAADTKVNPATAAKMADRKPIELEEMLRFMNTGQMPAGGEDRRRKLLETKL